MPHCSTGEPLPQLDLPAYIPSMSHQPVARFTVKDPNLLAPPEFMTPYSSSFPRRSSDGAADMPTLHRPYPLFGGSYPEQSNYRTEGTYPAQLPILPPEAHVAYGPTEPTTLENIVPEPRRRTSIQSTRTPMEHQDTLPVISAQKRFSLPMRQAPSMIDYPTSEKGEYIWARIEVGRNYVCCCEKLVNAFLVETQGKVSMEAIQAFKISLLQQGTVGILGKPECVESRSHGGYKCAPIRRGSEATQMRIWNQRIAQLYGTSCVPSRRGPFSRWLSYETKDQLEALSQVKRQELRACASANVPKAVQLERTAGEAQRAGSVPFAHLHQKSPKRLTICRVDSQHSLAMAESSESCDLGGSLLKRRARNGDTPRIFGTHSSWNEKLTAGQRRRQALPRSKSQVSWTDDKCGDPMSLKNALMDPTA
ncbi:unnamed protein product [Rodentolepis nana]|uniref:Uncharacterized protein n=1 Tax=Rodentolepis nana TaxID=102285 RepID=A0A3P7V6K5_RODNA|nr:unnamed protein product [Rodentolepis nana]